MTWEMKYSKMLNNLIENDVTWIWPTIFYIIIIDTRLILGLQVQTIGLLYLR